MQGYQQTYKLQLTKTLNKLVMKTDIPMFFLIHLQMHAHTEIRKHVQKGLYMHRINMWLYIKMYNSYTCVLLIYSMCAGIQKQVCTCTP